MKTFLVAVALIVTSQNWVFSVEYPEIWLMVDSTEPKCAIYSDDGLIDVYVVFGADVDEATGAEFRITNTTTMVHIADACPAGVVCTGNSQTGVTVSFPCVWHPFMKELLRVTYLGTGDSIPCSRLRVMPVDAGDLFHVPYYTCHPLRDDAAGGALLVRPNNSPGCDRCSEVVPVRDSTWGSIKALYEK